MTRTSFFVRVRARVHDERGFSLLETVFAIGIIFGSLLSLAYTATIGFGYESLARQRQSATGLANQGMEQIRGLAYAKVQTGLLTSELAGDSNIVTGCAGDAAGVYRFLSCTAGSTMGSGEVIVHSATAVDPTVPIVPHSSTTTQNGIAFTTQTYVTNNCPTVGGTCTVADPYRVTVLVTWTGGRTYPSKLVRIQSLFYSPTGCRSTETHPYAAPCQPFFYDTATVPRGDVTVTVTPGAGTVEHTTFSSGALYVGSVESSIQHEQLSVVDSSYTPTGVEITDGAGNRTAGGTTEVTAAADTDPGSPSTTTYSTVSYAGPAASTVSSGTDNSLTFTAAAGDTARSTSTTAAGVVNVCPPPTDTGETDGQPCAGSRFQQGGNLTSVLRLDELSVPVGSATLAKAGVASADPDKTFIDQALYPEVSMCTPVNGSDGCLESSASRRFGAINIGGLPSTLTGPPNWAGASAWNGYLVSIVGYADQVSAPVGRQVLASALAGTAVPAPSASVTAGTVYYWIPTPGDPTTGTYANASATGITAASLEASTMTTTGVVSGTEVTVTIEVVAGSVTPATTGTSTTVGGLGDLSRTEAAAQATPPKFSIRYRVWVNGNLGADLTIAVNLRTMEARGLYAAAPAEGS